MTQTSTAAHEEPSAAGCTATAGHTATDRRSDADRDTADKGSPQPAHSPARRDRSSPARTGSTREQVEVWEEEGGSPPDELAATESTPPSEEAGVTSRTRRPRAA